MVVWGLEELLMINVVSHDDDCTASGFTEPQSSYVKLVFLLFVLSLHLF